MYIRFTSKSKLSNLLPSSKKKYSLHEADEKLKELDRVFHESEKLVPMVLELTVKQKNDGFDVYFVSGNRENTNLLLLLEQTVDSFTVINQKEKFEWKKMIEEAYEEETAIPQEAISTDHSKTSFNKPKVKITKKIPTIHLFERHSKGKKAILLILPLLLIVSFGWFLFPIQSNKVPETESKASFETLYKEGKYREIIKEYPEKERELLDDLYLEKNKQGLKTLAESSSSGLANLYVAFLDKNWQAVTSIKEIPQDTNIQVLRGYAFLKQGKLEEAELINREIKNKTLATQIRVEKKAHAYKALREKNISVAEKINKDIEDEELAEDIVVAKSILNLLNKYDSDRQNDKLSESERKEAETNFSLWERNLQQLGN